MTALPESARVELWRTYATTRFVARTPSGMIELRHGVASPALDALMEEREPEYWCFIAAWNPRSQQLPLEENRERNLQLCRDLESLGAETLPGEGVGVDPSWLPEESFLARGIVPVEAATLGRKHGQVAVLIGQRGKLAYLIDCSTEERYSSEIDRPAKGNSIESQ